MRKGGLALAAAAGAVAFALRRRLRAGARERVEVYLEDGSMVSLAGSSPEAQRLVGLARDVLAAARS
jgi:ferric-dicitrate binding protein FerR (iron transport regulator)